MAGETMASKQTHAFVIRSLVNTFGVVVSGTVALLTFDPFLVLPLLVLIVGVMLVFELAALWPSSPVATLAAEQPHYYATWRMQWLPWRMAEYSGLFLSLFTLQRILEAVLVVVAGAGCIMLALSATTADLPDVRNRVSDEPTMAWPLLVVVVLVASHMVFGMAWWIIDPTSDAPQSGFYALRSARSLLLAVPAVLGITVGAGEYYGLVAALAFGLPWLARELHAVVWARSASANARDVVRTRYAPELAQPLPAVRWGSRYLVAQTHDDESDSYETATLTVNEYSGSSSSNSLSISVSPTKFEALATPLNRRAAMLAARLETTTRTYAVVDSLVDAGYIARDETDDELDARFALSSLPSPTGSGASCSSVSTLSGSEQHAEPSDRGRDTHAPTHRGLAFWSRWQSRGQQVLGVAVHVATLAVAVGLGATGVLLLQSSDRPGVLKQAYAGAPMVAVAVLLLLIQGVLACWRSRARFVVSAPLRFVLLRMSAIPLLAPWSLAAVALAGHPLAAAILASLMAVTLCGFELTAWLPLSPLPAKLSYTRLRQLGRRIRLPTLPWETALWGVWPVVTHAAFVTAGIGTLATAVVAALDATLSDKTGRDRETRNFDDTLWMWLAPMGVVGYLTAFTLHSRSCDAAESAAQPRRFAKYEAVVRKRKARSVALFRRSMTALSDPTVLEAPGRHLLSSSQSSSSASPSSSEYESDSSEEWAARDGRDTEMALDAGALPSFRSSDTDSDHESTVVDLAERVRERRLAGVAYPSPAQRSGRKGPPADVALLLLGVVFLVSMSVENSPLADNMVLEHVVLATSFALGAMGVLLGAVMLVVAAASSEAAPSMVLRGLATGLTGLGLVAALAALRIRNKAEFQRKFGPSELVHIPVSNGLLEDSKVVVCAAVAGVYRTALSNLLASAAGHAARDWKHALRIRLRMLPSCVLVAGMTSALVVVPVWLHWLIEQHDTGRGVFGLTAWRGVGYSLVVTGGLGGCIVHLIAISLYGYGPLVAAFVSTSTSLAEVRYLALSALLIAGWQVAMTGAAWRSLESVNLHEAAPWLSVVLWAIVGVCGCLSGTRAFALLQFADRRKRLFQVASAQGYINNDFAVVFYNGGEASSRTKISNVLLADESRVHYSAPSQSVAGNQDVVFEHCGYKTNGFVLEKLVVRVPKVAAYPLRYGMVWVHDELDAAKLASYTRKYDSMTLDEFCRLKRRGVSTEPILFFEVGNGSSEVIDIGMPAAGKYVHIKFLGSRVGTIAPTTELLSGRKQAKAKAKALVKAARKARAVVAPRVDVEFIGLVGYNKYLYDVEARRCGCGYALR
ncbi:uncharacterized protein AMSG_05075 [Thecamonas trahens ATCC 50062]|uniref:Uncharacterized protein n=1 Tax=Thecamonas trahens ATCC 50062 TaxID=461836 RepID=A0A0L0DAK6_THETB|nr:hypothetical protein AMSG_05075 [Thecamonas trahens ATCC 50062]KNC49106.1 hypothetical protein AMSG_05075 [Thecamonas trahens ATCC 50062]|eukprot:XP_013758134.1 hypothetical protein AMSG_05075 [Thecamonas trahens ATCC 50062]